MKRIGTTFVKGAPTVNVPVDEMPVLFSFRRCPYAIRARMMLAACGITYVLREVALKRKPPELLELSAKGTVPVLYLRQSTSETWSPDSHAKTAGVIDESLDIMRWALAQSDPYGWQKASYDRLASDLIMFNDSAYKKALDVYKYKERFDTESVQGALETCLDFFAQLEKHLSQTPWLDGEQLSPTDIAIFPFIRQFHLCGATAHNDESDNRPLRQATFPHVWQWMQTLIASELVAAVMGKHKPWQSDDAPVVYQHGRWKAPEPTIRQAAKPTDDRSDLAAPIRVAAFYRFVRIENCEDLQSTLRAHLAEGNLLGTILIAPEGINGTLAGTSDAISTFFERLRLDARFTDIRVKYQQCEKIPFQRAKVRIKKEIVASKDENISPLEPMEGQRGGLLDADAWDNLINRPDVTVIDVRNDYEYQLGHFEGAINPRTRSFGQFAQFVQDELSPERHKTIAMYCTGGIRCEKAVVMMHKMGFSEVYQLDGGILNYFEQRKHHPELTINTSHKQWRGDCFVFDERIAVNTRLEPAGGHLCATCGQPCHPADGCLVCGLNPQ